MSNSQTNSLYVRPEDIRFIGTSPDGKTVAATLRDIGQVELDMTTTDAVNAVALAESLNRPFVELFIVAYREPESRAEEEAIKRAREQFES